MLNITDIPGKNYTTIKYPLNLLIRNITFICIKILNYYRNLFTEINMYFRMILHRSIIKIHECCINYE